MRALPTIEPFDVARAIRGGSRLRLVDARDSSDRATIPLPTAELADAGGAGSLAANPGDTIVVVTTSSAGVETAMAVLRARGAVVLAMRGGTDGWIDQVLAPLPPPADAPASARERHREAVELSRWFGGLPSSVEREQRRARGDSAGRAPRRRVFRGC